MTGPGSGGSFPGYPITPPLDDRGSCKQSPGSISREATMATRIGIAGITGRMGHLLAEEVPAAGATLTGGVGRAGSTRSAPAGSVLLADLGALAAASDVVI